MTKERELLSTICQQIEPERYYNHSDISRIILPDGRRLDEALRNDPAAPPPLGPEEAGGVISLEGFADEFVPRRTDVQEIFAFVRSVADVIIASQPKPEQPAASRNGAISTP